MDISPQHVQSHYSPKMCFSCRSPLFSVRHRKTWKWSLKTASASIFKSSPLSRPLIWPLNNFKICPLLSISTSATLLQTTNTSDLSNCLNCQNHLPSSLMSMLISAHSNQTSLFTLPPRPKTSNNLSVASQCPYRSRLQFWIYLRRPVSSISFGQYLLHLSHITLLFPSSSML